jgi:hypothetical protein
MNSASVYGNPDARTLAWTPPGTVRPVRNDLDVTRLSRRGCCAVNNRPALRIQWGLLCRETVGGDLVPIQITDVARIRIGSPPTRPDRTFIDPTGSESSSMKCGDCHSTGG